MSKTTLIRLLVDIEGPAQWDRNRPKYKAGSVVPCTPANNLPQGGWWIASTDVANDPYGVLVLPDEGEVLTPEDLTPPEPKQSYKIVHTSKNVSIMQDTINEHLRDGWQIVGGVAVVYAPGGQPILMQALIRGDRE